MVCYENDVDEGMNDEGSQGIVYSQSPNTSAMKSMEDLILDHS